MAMIKCSECGKEVSDKAAVCPNCGNPIAAAPAPAAAVPANTAEKPKKKKKGLLIMFIVTIALWIFVAVFQKYVDSSYQKYLVYGKSGATEAYKEIDNYEYVTPDGDKVLGTYTGDWENNQPNGKGIYKSSDGIIYIDGNWENGQPNGQCKRIFKSDMGVLTYDGDFVFGVRQGNGDYRAEDSSGNPILTYSGEWKDDKFNGNGLLIEYYTDEEAAEFGINRTLYKGELSDDNMNGEGEMTFFYTDEKAKEVGADYMVCKGQMKDNTFVEPYIYVVYKDSQIIEEGVVKNGEYISD